MDGDADVDGDGSTTNQDFFAFVDALFQPRECQ
jgi:hypothetical protein